MFKRQQQSGFTLIELVVVISILAILAATAIPRFVSLQQQARIGVVNATVGAIREAVNLVNAKYQADLAAGVIVDNSIPGSSCRPVAGTGGVNVDGTDVYTGVLINGTCVSVVRSPASGTTPSIYAVGQPNVQTVYPAATPYGIGNALSADTTSSQNLQAVYSVTGPYPVFPVTGNSVGSAVINLSAGKLAFFAPVSAPTPSLNTFCQAVYDEGLSTGGSTTAGMAYASVYTSGSTAAAPLFGC